MKKTLLAVMGFVALNLSAATLTSEALKDYDGNPTGSVTITDADGNEVASGSEISGAVTITAAGENFSQWVGTFPSDATIDGNQISFTMPETNVRVTPVYGGMWVFDASAETISDGNWTLIVKVNNDGRSLTLGDWQLPRNSMLIKAGRGDMDLSGVVVSKDDGEEHKITYAVNTAFSEAAGDGNSVITSLILPRTLTSSDGQILNTQGSVMTNLVMDCPAYTKDLTGWFFSGHKKLERVVLKLPNVKKIGDQIFWGAPLSQTNLEEWDLSGVTELAGTFLVNASSATGNQLKGVIKLPNVKIVGHNAFKNLNQITGIVLGSNLTVESIGTNAVPSLVNLKSLVIGCSANGCTLVDGYQKPITVGPKMSEFVFLSGMPMSFDATIINWANETCLYVPKTWAPGSASWTDLLGVTVALGDEEKSAFQNNSKYAGQPVADGRFPQETFGQTVYCGRAYLPTWDAGTKVIVSVGDERAGDKVRVNGVEATRHAFYLEPGESVTATAVLVNEDAGCTWDCPGNADAEKDYTITATNLDTVVCTLWPRTVWTYLPQGAEGNPYANDIITNAYWAFNVKVYNASSQWLEIWNKGQNVGQAAGRGHGWIRGEGYLDFNGPIVGPNNSKWEITHISSCALASSGTIPQSQTATMIVYPRTMRSLEAQHLNSNNATYSSVTNLIINVPEATGKMSGWFAYGMGKLQDMTLKIPKITRLEGNLFEQMRPAGFDFSKWDLSSVTNIGDRAFVGKDQSAALPAKGVLRLPKIQSIGEQAFHALAPEAIELGMGYDIRDKPSLVLHRATFDTINYTKSITFGPYASIESLHEWVLGGSVITEMIFEGRWNEAMQDAVDKMLTTHAETTGAKAATIYASRALGWDKIADAVSETESASAPVGTMGVYRRDLRKAWLVHRESQYDPKGTFLIVR